MKTNKRKLLQQQQKPMEGGINLNSEERGTSTGVLNPSFVITQGRGGGERDRDNVKRRWQMDLSVAIKMGLLGLRPNYLRQNYRPNHIGICVLSCLF